MDICGYNSGAVQQLPTLTDSTYVDIADAGAMAFDPSTGDLALVGMGLEVFTARG